MERFSAQNAKSVITPLANYFKISNTEYSITDEEVKVMSGVSFTSAVGHLMYVMMYIRPDMAQVMSIVNKFLSNQGRVHWEVLKWILRYLRGTIDLSIMFNRPSSDTSIVGHVNADYARDLDTRRSTISYVYTLCGGLICWKSTVQSLVALSTTKSEYMAMTKTVNKALWLIGLVKELGVQ